MRGAGKPTIGNVAWEVRQTGLDLGKGEGGNELGVNGRGGDSDQGSSSDTGQGEDLIKEDSQILIGRGYVPA